MDVEHWHGTNVNVTIYITFIWTCVVVSVNIVACSLFLSICLFVLVNCLLNTFAIMCG